ncbi:MAG: GAF domain-containing protein, partial [Planctomycetota bacterium]
MAPSKTNHLRIYQETPPKGVEATLKSLDCLPEVLEAFRQVTGWSLRYAKGSKPNDPADLTWSTPANPGVGATPGHLRLEPDGSASAGEAGDPDPGAVRNLASALSDIVGELLETRHALWQREADLAAGVPLVPHPNAAGHLASRLQAVLKGGAEAVDCHAAALYLLDEATTSLKLRSSWGLPQARLLRPPRSLEGALADLEAMLGHAVVLEDTRLPGKWNPPEDFPSAVCVPVATPTNILGTLWVFSKEARPFNDRQTNIIEVVAGRVAAVLEREILMREAVDGAQLKRHLAAAERLQQSQFPTVAPLFDDWDIAGWTASSGSVGGDFHDWFILPDGGMAV